VSDRFRPKAEIGAATRASVLLLAPGLLSIAAFETIVTARTMIAMRYVAAGTVLGVLLAGCSTHIPYRNERPMTPVPDASELIPKCAITVRFNEDEASVPESDYLDSMFCLGLMEGLLGSNSAISANGVPLFCPPDPGIKTWIAAKVVVDFAKARPDLLHMAETDFAIRALAESYPCSQ
jgi:hypothetical protein